MHKANERCAMLAQPKRSEIGDILSRIVFDPLALRSDVFLHAFLASRSASSFTQGIDWSNLRIASAIGEHFHWLGLEPCAFLNRCAGLVYFITLRSLLLMKLISDYSFDRCLFDRSVAFHSCRCCKWAGQKSIGRCGTEGLRKFCDEF